MENRQRTIITIQNRINEARNKHTRVATVFVSTLSEVLALLKEKEAQKFFVDESGKITPLPVVVRCKDCKHRPKKPDWETYEDGGDIEFPDEKCPCQCSSDRYYSWYPDDDWFCAEGERK